MEHIVMVPRSRQLFEGNLFDVFERAGDEATRAAMNFKYISFDWVGLPGWFFWPRTRQGVYQIKEQATLQDGDETTVIFSLYYYPHPEEDVFIDFSLVEQAARVSEIFDSKGVRFYEGCSGHGHCGCHEEPFGDLREGKGIPVPDVRGRLTDSLYWVGALTILWRQNDVNTLTLEAPGRSRTWAIVDIPGPRDGGPALKAGDIDRNVPCWHLAKSFAVALTEDFGRSICSIEQFGGQGKEAMKRCVIGLRKN